MIDLLQKLALFSDKWALFLFPQGIENFNSDGVAMRVEKSAKETQFPDENMILHRRPL